MNALAHCVEAAWSPQRTPEAEAIALAGVARPSPPPCPRWSPPPTTSTARSAMLEGACLAGRCLHNAGDGRAPRPGPAPRRPHGHPARPRQRRAPRPRRCGSTRRRCPTRWPASARRSARPTTRPAPSIGSAAALGLPGRLSDAGVAEEELEAVARLSQSQPQRRGQPAARERGRRPRAPARGLVITPPAASGPRPRLVDRWDAGVIKINAITVAADSGDELAKRFAARPVRSTRRTASRASSCSSPPTTARRGWSSPGGATRPPSTPG